MEGQSEIPWLKLCRLAERAIKVLGRDSNGAEAAVEDILDVTNLIEQEGGSCVYVHKTVVEYHCAEFVSQLPDAMAARVYGRMVGKSAEWRAELAYLKHIDRAKYEKYFVIPELTRLNSRLEAVAKADKGFENGWRDWASSVLAPSGQYQVRCRDREDGEFFVTISGQYSDDVVIVEELWFETSEEHRKFILWLDRKVQSGPYAAVSWEVSLRVMSRVRAVVNAELSKTESHVDRRQAELEHELGL